MVRKQDRKEVGLIDEATHTFTNKMGVVCYGLKKDDVFFALNPEHTKWTSIPKWAFNLYFLGS